MTAPNAMTKEGNTMGKVPRKGKLWGYMLGVLAAASYGSIPLFTLPCYQAGMNPVSTLVVRYLFALPVLAIMLKMRGHNFKITGRQTFTLFILGLLMASSSITLFMSYNYMAVGIASTLLFIYPLLVALLMAVFFHERLTPLTILSLFMSMGGIDLLFKGGEGETLSVTGTIFVFISALTYALYIIAVNKTHIDSLPTIKITFYVIFFGFFPLALLNVFYMPFTLPQEGNTIAWFSLAGLVLFPTVISFLCTTASIQSVGPTATAILGAFEPVTGILFGQLVFDEVLTGREWCGVAAILFSVLMVISSGSLPMLLGRIKKLFPVVGRNRK